MGCFTLEAPAAVAWRCPPDVAMQVDGGNADALLAAGTHQLTMTGPLDALMQVSADGVTLRPPVPVHGRCSPLLVLPLAPGEEPVPLGRLTPSGEA
jgi:hypothetical protein